MGVSPKQSLSVNSALSWRKQCGCLHVTRRQSEVRHLALIWLMLAMQLEEQDCGRHQDGKGNDDPKTAPSHLAIG